MKIAKDAIEFTHEETEALFGCEICECGTLLPLWEWAKRKTTCEKCKQRPSQEDITGKRHEWTPKDWKCPHLYVDLETNICNNCGEYRET